MIDIHKDANNSAVGRYRMNVVLGGLPRVAENKSGSGTTEVRMDGG